MELSHSRRIAMLSGFAFIRAKKYQVPLALIAVLMDDKEDLMHKAVGWMLREIGNRAPKTERSFLKMFYKKMPRTALRCAIEKFPEVERQAYLKGRI